MDRRSLGIRWDRLGRWALLGVFALVLGLLVLIYIACIIAILGIELNVVLSRRLYPRALLTPFTDAVQRLLLENAALTPAAGYAGLLSEKTVARFSAICLVSTVKHWLESPRTASVDELVDAYLYLVSHSAWM